MRLQKQITGIFSCLGILVLILDGRTALNGAAAGLELCLKTVIPSLFPFLFLCSLLTNSLWGLRSSRMQWISRRLGIPEGAESILISAILGGYPAGAQTVGSAFQMGSLAKEDALHLLTFCSNPGPAFLFGMTSAVFPDKGVILCLWMIQILSALLTAITGHHTPNHSASLPASDPSASEVLVRTIRTMAVICGWVLLFRVVAAFLEHWVLFRFSPAVQVFISGLLELSNGCISLGLIDNIALRFVMCSVFLSAGGLCVTMQTVSVIGGLSPIPYLTGKLRQTLFSLVLSLLYLHLGWIVLMILGIFLLVFPVKTKIKGGFPSLQGV